MTEMTMREKMARAIYENVDVDSIKGEIDVSRAVDACLDALMDPTAGMMRAGFWVCSNESPDPSDVLEAMIQAAKDGK